MNVRKICWIGLPLLAALFSSCLNKQYTDIELSPYAHFVSLAFAANDSFPGLEDAVFTAEYDPHYDDTLIVNLDSLPYLTEVDSVYATFRFYSTSVCYLVQEKPGTPDRDTVLLVGSDTLDFTRSTWVYNRSSDGSSEAQYRIKVNVHQVDPELYVWKQLNAGVTAYSEINQKAIAFEAQGNFLFFTGNDTETQVYTSTDQGVTWSAGVALNLPADNTSSLKLRYMTEYAGKLYVTDNAGNLYRSADGVTWETAYDDADNPIYNLLFPLDGALWGIMRTSTGDYCLGMTTDGVAWEDRGALPQYWNDASRMFPIDDYAALVFKSRVGKPKMMVLGGLNRDGARNRTTWLSENGYAWEPIDDGALQALQGAALMQYDDKLLLFGGMTSTGNIVPLLESANEGLSWAVPDSASNVLPEGYAARAYQSLILDEEDKRFYLIGGRNSARTFSDVWSVKLNRMYFEE